MTRQISVHSRLAAADESGVYYMSADDRIDKYDVKNDRVECSRKVLDSGDSVTSLVLKNKFLYLLYQTVIGETNISVWNSDLNKLTSVSSIE
jgi:hypothetical protein